ncbi:MAG: hypothetical protein IPG12_14280 [Saprospiraceae bacterium]|nr:hypothetical protein [Saprospiraceae bacterium]
MTKETIEILHNKGDKLNTDVNYKTICFKFNDHCVIVTIPGEGNFSPDVDIQISNKNSDEGFWLHTKIHNRKMYLSIDADGGRTETAKRTYYEWLRLERLENAIKLISSVWK